VVTGGRDGRRLITDISVDYIRDRLKTIRANQTAAGRFLGSNDVTDKNFLCHTRGSATTTEFTFA
jgi:hypothetical protein